MQVTILHARRFKFVDEKTGRPVEGARFTYNSSSSKVRDDERGSKPVEVKGAYDLYDQLIQVPGYYNADFEPRTDGKGQPYMVLVELEPIAEPVALANGTASAVAR